MLVGRRTVDDDDPELTCRLPGLASRSPRRVVLDPGFRIVAPQLKMFATARRVPILVFGAAGGDAARLPRPASRPGTYPPAPTGASISPRCCASLAQDGVTRVLVEGGPTIASALLAADLVDEVVIARGTEPSGAAGRKPFGERGLEVARRCRPLAARAAAQARAPIRSPSTAAWAGSDAMGAMDS